MHCNNLTYQCEELTISNIQCNFNIFFLCNCMEVSTSDRSPSPVCLWIKDFILFFYPTLNSSILSLRNAYLLHVNMHMQYASILFQSYPQALSFWTNWPHMLSVTTTHVIAALLLLCLTIQEKKVWHSHFAVFTHSLRFWCLKSLIKDQLSRCSMTVWTCVLWGHDACFSISLF